jgi:hypothetical protein
MNSLINFIFVVGARLSIAEVRENRKGIKENYLIYILLTSYMAASISADSGGDCGIYALIKQGFFKSNSRIRRRPVRLFILLL